MKVFGRKMRNIKDIILNIWQRERERERDREWEKERHKDAKKLKILAFSSRAICLCTLDDIILMVFIEYWFNYIVCNDEFEQKIKKLKTLAHIKIIKWLFYTRFLAITYISKYLFSVPPKSVTLRQPTPVMAGNSIELACTAEDSNPKTEIVWYRDNQPIREAGKSFLLQNNSWKNLSS